MFIVARCFNKEVKLVLTQTNIFCCGARASKKNEFGGRSESSSKVMK
jgi:hypothetical protein